MRSFIGASSVARIFAATPHIVAGNAVLEGIEPRRQRSKRRPTKWRRNIPTFEDETAGSQFIEVRRFDIRMPHKAIVHPCLVIAQDEHDVGWLLGCYGLTGRNKQ